jgi:hypothetical protein
VCLVVAKLPYLPDELQDDPAYAEYLTEPAEALFSPDCGLAHYRRLLDAAEERLDVDGALVDPVPPAGPHGNPGGARCAPQAARAPPSRCLEKASNRLWQVSL